MCVWSIYTRLLPAGEPFTAIINCLRTVSVDPFSLGPSPSSATVIGRYRFVRDGRPCRLHRCRSEDGGFFFSRSLFPRNRYSALIDNSGCTRSVWLYNARINNNNSPRSRHSLPVRICHGDSSETELRPRRTMYFYKFQIFVRRKGEKNDDSIEIHRGMF